MTSPRITSDHLRYVQPYLGMEWARVCGGQILARGPVLNALTDVTDSPLTAKRSQVSQVDSTAGCVIGPYCMHCVASIEPLFKKSCWTRGETRRGRMAALRLPKLVYGSISRTAWQIALIYLAVKIFWKGPSHPCSLPFLSEEFRCFLPHVGQRQTSMTIMPWHPLT